MHGGLLAVRTRHQPRRWRLGWARRRRTPSDPSSTCSRSPSSTTCRRRGSTRPVATARTNHVIRLNPAIRPGSVDFPPLRSGVVRIRRWGSSSCFPVPGSTVPMSYERAGTVVLPSSDSRRRATPAPPARPSLLTPLVHKSGRPRVPGPKSRAPENSIPSPRRGIRTTRSRCVGLRCHPFRRRRSSRQEIRFGGPSCL